MSKNLNRALKQQKKQTQQTREEIYGTLGIPLDGRKIVEVPNRNSYVYVKLRDNPNEVVQAFNNKVAQSYGLPVIIHRDGNRYSVQGVNTQRYENNWYNSAPYLPLHGTSHSFPEGGGGDIVWVFARQILMSLVYPDSVTGTNVKVFNYPLLASNNTWKYTGGTGTVNLLNYLPVSGSASLMSLVYLDANTGNPGVLVNSGTYFSYSLTGSVYPFIPIPNSSQIPLAGVRLSSGMHSIEWENIYDVRQWIHPVPTGSGGGSSLATQDEGIPLGTPSTYNFVGGGVTVTVSGTVARIDVPSSSMDTGTLDGRYLKLDASNDPLTGLLSIIPNPPSGSLYAQSNGDFVVGTLKQLPSNSGDVNNSVLSLFRGPSGSNSPFFRETLLLARTDSPPTGSNAGGLLKYYVNGASDFNLITSINPHIAGTGNAAMLDTTATLQWDGHLLLMKNAGVPKFYIDGVGTSHSNETYSQAFIHEDSGISFREQNSNGSFVWLKGNIGSAGISGYLRSQLQTSLNTTELITNGSFESGTFIGWTVVGSPTITTIDPFSGLYAAKCTASGTISQSPTVVSGSYYLLEFDTKMDNDDDFQGIVSITNGDQANYNPGNQHGGKWIRGATLIRALSTSITLKFMAAAGTNFVYFDNVTLKLASTFSLEGMDSSGRWNVVSQSATPLLLNGVAASTLPEAPINSNTYARGNASWISDPVFVSGTAVFAYGSWNPTLVSGTNTQTISASNWHYMRSGDIVTFSGLIQVDTGAVGAFTCYVSLPIPSNFDSQNDASGNGTHPGAGTPNIISIREDQTNDRLQLDGYAQVSTNLFYRCVGQYIIK